MSALKGLGTSMDNNEYSEFSRFLSDVCGIVLGDNKQYLVTTRVRRILQDHSLASLGELTKRITSGGDRALQQKVIDAMTTNETFWFRDGYPFEYFENVLLPAYKTEKSKKVRVWSAACSSGQEPYSISMIFEESLKKIPSAPGLQMEIVATDLSSKILQVAKHGHYDKLAIIRGLSDVRARQHFTQVDAETWKINSVIKDRVQFKPVNLQESQPVMGKFDVVFCRNVLIYFSAESKKRILKKIHSTLHPGGVLFLGSSESVSELSEYYEMIHCNPGVAYRAKPLKH